MAAMRSLSRLAGRVALCALAAGLSLPHRASPALVTVTTLADENDGCGVGACSLREALAAANAGDTIDFAVSGTITLNVGPLVPASDVVVAGPGAASLTVSGAQARRVLSIPADRQVEISDLAIAGGRAPSDGDRHGGCIANAGDLVLRRVLLSDCLARSLSQTTLADGGDGGAIYNASGATLVLDTVEVRDSRAGKGGGNPMPPYPAGGRGGGLFNAGTARVADSTFAANRAGEGGGVAGAGGAGGAIFSSGPLLLEASTLADNASGDGAQFCAPTCITGADGKGGGLAATGELALTNVTVSGNAIGSTAIGTSATGGGLLLAPGGSLVQRLRNVTVVGNTASGAGGGIAREGTGSVRLRHVLLAGNVSTGSTSEDCTGGGSLLVSEGHNLVGVNNGCATVFAAPDLFGTAASPLAALLGALGANGGPTETHALLAGSPALDAGAAAGCFAWDPGTGTDVPLLVDQRGEPRPRDGDGDLDPVCDIGSYEAPDLPVTTYLLTVTPLGMGTGEVTSAPAGIDCPGDCSEVYVEGTPVDLAAAAAAGSTFGSWSGDCAGTGACQVTMSADRTVGATFLRLFPLQVSLAGAGAGTVASDPAGIACPPACLAEYVEGSGVTLTATPTPPALFAGWSGDCDGRLPCTLTLDGAKSATARFEPPAIFADGFESGDLTAWE